MIEESSTSEQTSIRLHDATTQKTVIFVLAAVKTWSLTYRYYNDGCLLGCSPVYSGRSLPTFQRTLLPPSSGRYSTERTEATRTSETSVNFYQTTREYNPEDSHIRTNRRENLKSYYRYYVWREACAFDIRRFWSLHSHLKVSVCHWEIFIIFIFKISGDRSSSD
jgi:hypothetical protein